MDKPAKPHFAGFTITVSTVQNFRNTLIKEKRTIHDLAFIQVLSEPKKSYHDTVMKLIKIKRDLARKEGKVNKIAEKYFKITKLKLIRQLSADTDLELEYDSLTNIRKKTVIGYRIKGTKIIKDIPEKVKEPLKPVLFHSELKAETPEPTEPEQDETEPKLRRGTIRYKLSDRGFIEKGWTVLPTELVVRKKNVYRVVPAHPQSDWFKKNKHKGLLRYETGEKFAEFDENGGGGRWYYKNGNLALKCYYSEEINTRQRYLVYSSGEPDDRGRRYPLTLLAMFDLLGNGVVFDHAGKIRLKYDQSDGIVLDRTLGPATRWQWHSLNDPPTLQRVMTDTYMDTKDPGILKLPIDHRTVREDSADMLEIEFNNCVKERSRKTTEKFQPYQIRMKALKVNDQFSLRILDQTNIYLAFREGSLSTKLNLGIVLDTRQIINTATEEAGDISNSLENKTDQTDSILDMQTNLYKVRQMHQARIRRDSKVNPAIPKASVDYLTRALSRPISTFKTQNSNCSESYCKKKPQQVNLYYENQLL